MSLDPAALHLGDLAFGFALGGLAALGAASAQTLGGATGRRVAAGLAPVAGALALVVRHRGPAVVVLAVTIAAVGAVSATPAVVRSAGAVAAVLVALSLTESLSSGARVAAGAAVILAALGLEYVERAEPAIGMLLLALTLGGIWAAVPDTEAVLLVVGVLAPVAVTTLLPRGLVPPAPWAVAAVVVAAAGAGAEGRPAALAGALACWGVLLVIGLTVATPPRSISRGSWAVLVTVQVVAVALASRWAARTGLSLAGWGRSAAVLTATAAAVVITLAFASRSEPATG